MVESSILAQSAHAKPRIHYTGWFNVKYMVQARQFRKSHKDSHYAAAVFWDQRELAVRFQSDAIFVCTDDKYRIKVGEFKSQLLLLTEVDMSLSVLMQFLRL